MNGIRMMVDKWIVDAGNRGMVYSGIVMSNRIKIVWMYISKTV